MGFRSVFITEDFGIKWPDWFRQKYANSIHFPPEGSGCIASVTEKKTYGWWEPLPEDIQKAIDWESFRVENFVLVYLHECGGITRCQISKDKILWSEPEGWRKTEGVEHDYCYGCSEQ